MRAASLWLLLWRVISRLQCGRATCAQPAYDGCFEGMISRLQCGRATCAQPAYDGCFEGIISRLQCTPDNICALSYDGFLEWVINRLQWGWATCERLFYDDYVGLLLVEPINYIIAVAMRSVYINLQTNFIVVHQKHYLPHFNASKVRIWGMRKLDSTKNNFHCSFI